MTRLDLPPGLRLLKAKDWDEALEVCAQVENAMGQTRGVDWAMWVCLKMLGIFPMK